MLDAAPFRHGFQSVPLPRVDRQPVLHLHRQHAPGEPTLVVLRLPFGRVLGDLLVALQPPGRQPQDTQVAREAAARQPPPRSRRRVLSCQQPAGTVKPCSAAGGLFEAEPRHRRWSRSRSVLPPTRERSRGSLPWATALAFSSALSRASASVTMGYRPKPRLHGLPLMRSLGLHDFAGPPPVRTPRYVGPVLHMKSGFDRVSRSAPLAAGRNSRRRTSAPRRWPSWPG